MRPWPTSALALPLLLPVFGDAVVPEPSAAAQDLVRDAQEWLVVEIDLLAELDVFVPDPTIDEIRQRVPTGEAVRDRFPDGAAERDALIRALDDVDDQNVDRLDRLFEANLVLSEEVVMTMDLLPDEIIDPLDAGRTGFLDPTPWLDAMSDLIVRQGGAPPDRDDAERQLILVVIDDRQLGAVGPLGRPGSLDEPTDLPTIPRPAGDDLPIAATDVDRTAPQPAVVAAPTAVAPATDGGDPAPMSLAMLAAAAGLTALVAIATTSWLRRRPSVEASGPTAEPQRAVGRLDELLDTSRRMTAALDGQEVQRIAVRDGVRLARAEAGAFLSAGAEPRFTEAAPPDLFTDRPVQEGLLARVLETGQSTCATTDDEPALARLPMAIAAVPVIARGGVAGALVVLRSPAEPFGSDDVDTLAHLAPIVGTALNAAEEHRSAVTDAERDGLTTLLNRRRLDHDLAAVTEAPTAFAMIDVDHFKRFNDLHGHQGGDDALRAVADVLSSTVRSEDIVYRYGGEEFSILLRDTTTEQAREVLERVRAAVEQAEIIAEDGRSLGHVSISVGVATAEELEPATQLPGRADRALYDAKAMGRNRVVVDT